jgi:hypothetical protein
VLFPGTNSASPPILSITTAANKLAIAVAPVQPGSPILTFSAKEETAAKMEIIAATSVVLIIHYFIFEFDFQPVKPVYQF